MLSRGSRARRSLVTVLFTDIVGSTVRAAELGDRQWRELLARHHSIVRRRLRQHGGREVDTAGDGFLSVFESPADAIACACDVRDDVTGIGLEIRAGLHTGEIEASGEKVSGITVHIASRVLATAGPSEVLVSSTVRDIAAGADFTFEDRGLHQLKGVPGDWHLYAADRTTRPDLELQPDRPAAGVSGTRRAGVIVVGVVGFLVVAVGGAAFLLGGSGFHATASPTPLLIGPDAIVGIDPSTNRTVDSIRVGRGPGPVVYDGTHLWVGNISARTVSRVDPATGVKEDKGQFGTPTDLAFGERYVWVVDALPGERAVWAVDPTNPDSVQLIPGVDADAIAVGEGFAWVVDEGGRSLRRIDVRTLLPSDNVVDLSGHAEAPNAIAVTEGAVWIADRLSPRVLRVGTSGDITEIPLLVQPTDFAVTGLGYVWFTAKGANSVIRIDPRDSSVVVIGDLLRGPAGLAPGSDRMWVALDGSHSVVSIDAARVVSTPIDVVAAPAGLAVAGDRVWVTLQGTSE